MADMMVYYPHVERKTCTKQFTCSGCENPVPAGATYYRYNTGRYCHECNKALQRRARR